MLCLTFLFSSLFSSLSSQNLQILKEEQDPISSQIASLSPSSLTSSDIASLLQSYQQRLQQQQNQLLGQLRQQLAALCETPSSASSSLSEAATGPSPSSELSSSPEMRMAQLIAHNVVLQTQKVYQCHNEGDKTNLPHQTAQQQPKQKTRRKTARKREGKKKKN